MIDTSAARRIALVALGLGAQTVDGEELGAPDATRDIVAMDDVIHGEPHALP